MTNNNVSKEKAGEIISFVDNHKSLVGMSDWNVIVLEKLLDNDSKAEVDIDIYEQILKLSISKCFLNSSLGEQQQILIHELVHARIAAFDDKVEKFVAIEQELLANDLERGFSKLLDLKK